MEEALRPSWREEKVILLKDSVHASASFLLHYFLKHIFTSSPIQSADKLVVFVGLSEPFSHYNRIARKQGCNLAAYCDSGNLVFLDMLSATDSQQVPHNFISNVPGTSINECAGPFDGQLFQLYRRIWQILRKQTGSSVWIFIDDVSMLEVVAQGSRNNLLDFLHYCRALSSNEKRCSLILLVHQDVYQLPEETMFVKNLEYWADIVISVEPLGTGRSVDVHGQVTIVHRALCDDDLNTELKLIPTETKKNVHNFHYKIMENAVLFFPPGKHF